MNITIGAPIFRAILLGIALLPAATMAQKRDDILSIQRDVAQLQDRIKQLQAGQDQKLAALEGLIKQALDESGKLSLSAAALERSLTDRLNEQQAQVEAPIAVLGTKLDQSADELRSARENLTDLSRRLAALDNKLADISSAVRTLNTTASGPPLSGSDTAAASASPLSTTPSGLPADSLWQKALRDYSGAKDKLALSEFADFVKYFPQHANAAQAQFNMGMIYDHGQQFEDAAEVFEAVAERYPDSPKAADALYMKGVEYQKAGSGKEAIAAYRVFLKKYPNHSDAPKAMARLRILGAAAKVRTRKRK